MTDEQFNRIVSLLDQIASCQRDQNTLAEKRRRKAERQARYRKNLASKSAFVDATNDVASTKEDESGKENLPPTPPIREKGKEEESISRISRAHASVVSSPVPEEPLPPVIDLT